MDKIRKVPLNKKHVIDVASNLFFVNGYSYTSMDEITRVSGVSKSNIYYHFGSKEELLVAVIDYWIVHYESLIRQTVTQNQFSVEVRILSFFNSLVQEIIDREYKGSCPFITLYIQSPMQSNLVKNKISTFFKQLEPIFTDLFRQGVKNEEFRQSLDCKKTANLFIVTMEGAIILTETMQDSTILSTVAKSFCKMLH